MSNADAEELSRLLQAQTERIAALERFAPSVLLAYLDGASWSAALDAFVEARCPLFRGWVPEQEHALEHTRCHNEFVACCEALIDGRLAEMGLSAERLVDIAAQGCDESSAGIVRRLETFRDFLEFGAMMAERCASLYGGGGGGGGAPAAPGRPRYQHVRVLWDVENVAIPAGCSPFAVGEALRRWLQRAGYAGEGTDTLVTAFFCPSKRTLSKAATAALDKSLVELVCCSEKREDADRKLTDRLARDAAVLPPGATAFVVVSSDGDFRAHCARVKGAGFHVAVVHSAKGDHAASLALQTSASFAWQDVVGDVPRESAAAAASASASATASTAAPGEKGAPRRGRRQRSPPLDRADGESLSGVVAFWNAERGWGKIEIDGGGGEPRVFVHNTALVVGPATRRRALCEGERVVFVVASDRDGRKCAAKVAGESGRRLRCEEAVS